MIYNLYDWWKQEIYNFNEYRTQYREAFPNTKRNVSQGRIKKEII